MTAVGRERVAGQGHGAKVEAKVREVVADREEVEVGEGDEVEDRRTGTLRLPLF